MEGGDYWLEGLQGVWVTVMAGEGSWGQGKGCCNCDCISDAHTLKCLFDDLYAAFIVRVFLRFMFNWVPLSYTLGAEGKE